MARVHIGLSGYSYKPWQGQGRFYPEHIKAGQFLGYYASRYGTVELDGIWYRFPTEKTVLNWVDQTRDGFLFAPKAHRQITHIHRLKPDALDSVRLLLQRLTPLIEHRRLGPILLQLPPNLRRDDARLQHFFAHIPKDQRWAIEFRHPSWHSNDVESLLRLHGIAWVAAETDDMEAEWRHTAPFWYVRLRRSQYTERELTNWATRLTAAAAAGDECFVYCKHEDQGSPWVWADALLQLTAA